VTTDDESAELGYKCLYLGLRIVREKLLQRVSAALNINESPLGEEARTRGNATL
jgi:hypothetical protein